MKHCWNGLGGEFDSEVFDLDAVNRMLRQVR